MAERLDARDAQCAGALEEFVPALGGEFVGAAVAGVGEAEGAVGGDDEDDAVSLCGRLRHRARGEQRLVVGVSVEGDKRARHGIGGHGIWRGHRVPSSRMTDFHP